MERSSGVLLPIFSLPNKYGIGTFGKEAYEFVDFLSEMGVKYWQVLPMHPLTYGNSPYQSTSTFAGNKYFIDLDMLSEKGLLEKADYESADFGNDEHKVDYNKIYDVKNKLLKKAAKVYIEKFIELQVGNEKINDNDFTYEKFCDEFDYFLNDFAIFDLIKDRYEGQPFSKWDKIHRLHYDEVIKEFEKQNKYELEIYKVIQYFFFEQWLKLKKYANDKNVKIIGDMPIYSSLDSVEVFVDYKNFVLDENRRPYEVAGCPPDAFSADGQLWGNPLYDYNYMKENGYKYFIKRIAHLSKLYDVIRIDHFRGFASYYSIKATDTNARNGEWKLGPGIDIFNAINEELPNLSIIAEDLGLIDDTVRKLLSDTKYPGMKVVEFAFGGDVENHPYLPKNYNENCVAYLGTHDNDTFIGWLNKANDNDKKQAIKFLHLGKENTINCIDNKNDNINNSSNDSNNSNDSIKNNISDSIEVNDKNTIKDNEKLDGDIKDISFNGYNRDAITELFKSKANLTVVMMQDLLGYGTETRINVPSTVGDNNWSYRFDESYLDKSVKEFLKKLIEDTRR